MYVNDICNLQLHSKTYISLYADDTALFHHGKDYKVCEYNLQKYFSNIVKWLHYNGMFLNTPTYIWQFNGMPKDQLPEIMNQIWQHIKEKYK